MALARFVALHEVAEADCGNVGRATFAVVIAGSTDGAVFACDVDDLPTSFANDEIGAVGACRRDSRPQPLGECDAALLNRFG